MNANTHDPSTNTSTEQSSTSTLLPSTSTWNVYSSTTWVRVYRVLKLWLVYMIATRFQRLGAMFSGSSNATGQVKSLSDVRVCRESSRYGQVYILVADVMAMQLVVVQQHDWTGENSDWCQGSRRCDTTAVIYTDRHSLFHVFFWLFAAMFDSWLTLTSGIVFTCPVVVLNRRTACTKRCAIGIIWLL